MKKVISLFVLVLSVGVLFCQGSLKGSLMDGNTEEPLLFANVKVFKSGMLVAGTQTDFDGAFSIENLEAGKYDLSFSYVGYIDQLLEGVVIKDGEITQIMERLESFGCGWIITCYWRDPIITMEPGESGMTFTLNKKGMIKQ
ncbi:MAG: carboxypeptidase-like regulatory domain-containing protein [Bacteroidetes bacterium]|nr:carboxypeptidase-like regulatory domain-containing protein [Bacteroidota bacterium]